MKHLRAFESFYSSDDMSREEMITHLCNWGYDRNELEKMETEELSAICLDTPEETSESKKWMQEVISKPGFKKGALRKTAKKMGLIKGDEKLSMADIKKLKKSDSPITRKRANLAEQFMKCKRG